MKYVEFRAYDPQGKMMVYDKDAWLPQGLGKLGLHQHPVRISPQGIHYSLDCLSEQYADEWEEDVVTRYGIELMPFTNFWDEGEPKHKLYSSDIIAFYLSENTQDRNHRHIGKIQFCNQSEDWVVVDRKGHFLEKLSQVKQPHVLGNSFENPELLN